MFQRRLVLLLSLVVAGATILAVRLFQLQVLRAEHYRGLSEAALERPPEILWPLRGRVHDRTGVVLLADEPAHDVTMHYGVLSMDDDYLATLARRAAREPPLRELPAAEARARAATQVREQIAATWVRLSRASGVSTATLLERRDEICRRVESLRSYLWRAWARRGYDEPLDSVRLAEDDMRHPILRDISPQVRSDIELQVGELPYLRIEPSVRRTVHPSRAMAHLLGRLGEVSTKQMDADPNRDDERRRYLPGEQVGISGVERAAERWLRGVRGIRQRDLDNRVLLQQPPEDGRDVRLSIDLTLQEAIEPILTTAVANHPPASGAACVVLDCHTREILAAVSVPTFDPRDWPTRYREWRDDARGRPLLFRAVSEEYPPGSIIKPLALLAGLSSGQVSAATRVECRGRLFENQDAWFCWTQWRGMAPHGSLDSVGAIQHSCNIYFYTLGQRVGAERLCAFYRAVLWGPAEWSGTGLIEERRGLIPFEAELIARRGHGYSIGDARNYALGQGELQITPLMAANLFATIAIGEFREPTLFAGEDMRRPAAALPGVRAAHLNAVREGLWRCVNEPGGTAFEGARLDDTVACGKTGSAQAAPRVIEWLYSFRREDGQTRHVQAPSPEAAREQLDSPGEWQLAGRKPLRRWPEVEAGREKMPTHAWFAGFAPREAPRVAIAVVIEYGGSGGKVAAPVGRAVFELLLDHPAGYLSRDAALEGRARRPRVEPPDVE